MKHHVLYLTRGGEENGIPSEWRDRLVSDGFEFLHITTPRQAVLYAATYPIAGLLVDLDQCGEAAAEWVEAVHKDERANHLGIYGVCRGPREKGDLEALCQAGLKNVFTMDCPGDFIVHTLQTRRDLQKLSGFEQTGADVTELSTETRKLLHEMSQPLSALQGRLQIQQARMGKDDPEYERISGLVDLCMEVSRHLYATQELQRKYAK